MRELFYVFLGGGAGSLVRYLLWLATRKQLPDFPVGTVLANLLGTFLIGYLSIAIVDSRNVTVLRPLILFGFLGGLTTFSTFGMDSWSLFASGKYFLLSLYLFLNLVVGITLLVAGRHLHPGYGG